MPFAIPGIKVPQVDFAHLRRLEAEREKIREFNAALTRPYEVRFPLPGKESNALRPL
jgi:hypothetical protein